MKQNDLAQFEIYRAPGAYNDLKKKIEYFINGRQAFHAATSHGELRGDSATLILPEKILSRPGSRTGT